MNTNLNTLKELVTLLETQLLYSFPTPTERNRAALKGEGLVASLSPCNQAQSEHASGSDICACAIRVRYIRYALARNLNQQDYLQ